MSVDGSEEVVVGQIRVPYFQGRVQRIADQVVVLEHFERDDIVVVSYELPHFLPRFQVPQADRLVMGATCQPAVWQQN